MNIINPYRFAAAATLPQIGNLEGYWKLDETSGTRADSHSNGYTLTDNGTVTGAASKNVELGGAGQFTAANEEWLSNAAFPTSIHASAFSAACWVYLDSSVSGGIIGQYGTSLPADQSWLLYYSATSTKFVFLMKNSVPTTFSCVANSTPSNATWYHLAATKSSGGAMKLYVDGTAQTDTDTFSGTPGSNDVDLTIGYFISGGTEFWFDGRIDEAGVWTTELSASEVGELYNSGDGRTY